MLALWLAAVLVSLSPWLHESLHSDSQSANHTCLVTLLTKSHLWSSPSPVVRVRAPNTRIELPPAAAPVCPSSTDCRLAPSRAPPAPAPLPTVAG